MTNLNSTYLKATLREITYSWGKFISIVLIIMLGSLLYVGIRATGPSLDKSADHYFDQHQLSDMTISSTLGLTKRDLQVVQNDPNVQIAEPSHMVTVKKSQNEVAVVYSFMKNAKLNRLELVSGHFPKTQTEIVLDTKAKKDGYRIGQDYHLPKTAGLKGSRVSDRRFY